MHSTSSLLPLVNSLVILGLAKIINDIALHLALMHMFVCTHARQESINYSKL